MQQVKAKRTAPAWACCMVPMTGSCINDQYEKQACHNPCGNDLPLGCTDTLKKSWRGLFQTSLQQVNAVNLARRAICERSQQRPITKCNQQKKHNLGALLNTLAHRDAQRCEQTLTRNEVSRRWCSSGLFAPSALRSSLSISCDNSLAILAGEQMVSVAAIAGVCALIAQSLGYARRPYYGPRPLDFGHSAQQNIPFPIFVATPCQGSAPVCLAARAKSTIQHSSVTVNGCTALA